MTDRIESQSSSLNFLLRTGEGQGTLPWIVWLAYRGQKDA
jgi:hypothetical protein